MRLHTLCIFLLLAPLMVLAQPKWEAGFLFGGAGYQGELTPEWYPEWEEVNRAYGLLLRHHISKEWALRLNLSYAELSGDDRHLAMEVFDVRNFRFQSQAGQVSLLAEWEPLGRRRYPDTAYFRGLISPYFFTGAGVAYLQASPDFSQTGLDVLTTRIEKDRQEPFPKTRLALPFGLGIKLDLAPGVLLSLEASATTAFTDYVDGISRAGKADTNDWYSYAGATLSFRFVPKDADRDGIADKDDACPQVEGRLSALGCPDQDEDGVEDLEDICPTEAGPRLLNGCPDTDEDGVADREDQCPLLPGAIPTKGCPDLDADGIADWEDECFRLPGPKGRRGCPVLDADADGELADEPEVCMLNDGAALLQRLELVVQPVFTLLRVFRPAFKKNILPRKPEKPEKEVNLESPGYFD